MKILMLTPYLPYPPASGGQIRTYNLLKYLSQSHEVHLVCLYKKHEEKQNANHLYKYCKQIYLCKRAEKPWQVNNILKSVFGLMPFLLVRNFSQEAKDVVEDILKTHTFDVIHAETFYIMTHIPQTAIPILLVEQTVEYRVYKHYISAKPWYIHHPLRLDTFKLKMWEKYYWRRASIVAVVSEADGKMISFLEPRVHPIVIPNGAGDEMFERQLLYPRRTPHDKLRMLFVGNFSWLQNSEAADVIIQQILPQLKGKLDRYTLVIAGQNIPARYHDLPTDHIEIVDLSVSADTAVVRDLYATCTIFVAPIYGPGGTRLKILAAMASRLPIITTSTGAEGLHLENGVSYMRAESVGEFAAQIVRLSGDPQLRDTLAEAAYQLASHRFSWQSITSQLIEAYRKIIR